MHVPQKTVFPSISCFVANISYSTLKLTPLIIFLLPPISWHIYHPKLSGALSEPSNSYAYTPKTPFSLASFFVANIHSKNDYICHFWLPPNSNPSHTYLELAYPSSLTIWGPHQSPKKDTHTAPKMPFSYAYLFCGAFLGRIWPCFRALMGHLMVRVGRFANFK